MRRDQFRAASAYRCVGLPGDTGIEHSGPNRKTFQNGICHIFGHLLQWLTNVIIKNSYNINSTCFPATKSCFGFVCYLKKLLLEISM